ncbi:MAG: peptidylprolyl isomerase [Promethearchaeota archaeon]|nr:MAG: peptidylprolyl isomerase [Candidatus Lokiarchaeota archaeon]
MGIKEGDIIKVEYEGRLEDGTIFDSTELNEGLPLKFEVGKGQLIRGFDDAVIGKNIGEEFTVTIQPNRAYGDFDPALRQTISIEQFPEDIEPEPGMMLRIDGPNNTYSVAWIKDVDTEFVTIDMNHPLAGKVLNFKIKILETGCEPDPVEACGSGCECGHEH